MIVYVWKRGQTYCLSRERPAVSEQDEPWADRRKGDLIPPMNTVSSVMPADLEPFLPGDGKVREMQFHVDLWGKSQELPSYDKRHWVELQSMLGD